MAVSPWLALVLMIVGLLGFIGAMCTIVYLIWRRPKLEEHLPDGQYHIHFMGYNKNTGAPIYDVEEETEDDGKPVEGEKHQIETIKPM